MISARMGDVASTQDSGRVDANRAVVRQKAKQIIVGSVGDAQAKDILAGFWGK